MNATSPARLGQKGADPTEAAAIWGLSQPHLRDLLYQSYRSGNVVDDCRRFHASAEFRETVRLLGEMGVYGSAGVRLLDVGCGNGMATYAFAREGYVATGIDISEGELSGLEAARSVMGLDGVQFRVINAKMEHLPFTEPFDVVYMRQALHHSASPESTVKELARLLKPGGLLCAIREHVVLNRRQLRHFLASHPFQHITGDEHAYTLRGYRAAFRRAGLERRLELFPYDSIINFYPGSYTDLLSYLSQKMHVNLNQIPLLRTVMLRLLAFKNQLREAQLYSFFYQRLT